MGQALQLMANPAGIIPGSTNMFAINDGALIASSPTESYAQQHARTRGQYRALYVRVNSNGISATTAVTFRKNAANGSNSLSIGAGATGEFSDGQSTDTVAIADDVCCAIVAGAGGTSMTVQSCGIVFAAFDGFTCTRFGGQSAVGNTISAASTTFYSRLSRQISPGTTEANEQIQFSAGGTCRNLQTVISVNARGNTTALVSRLNTANGGLSISIGAGATGLFEDVSGFDTVVPGDLGNLAWTLGTGTANLTIRNTGLDFETIDRTTQCIASSGASGVTENISVISYDTFKGGNTANGTKVNTQVPSRLKATYDLLRINVTANTISATSTVNLQVNGSNGSGSVSIGSLATGVLTDVSGSDPLATTDEIGYTMVTGGVGTSLTWRYISTRGTIAPAPTPGLGRASLRGSGVMV